MEGAQEVEDALPGEVTLVVALNPLGIVLESLEIAVVELLEFEAEVQGEVEVFGEVEVVEEVAQEVKGALPGEVTLVEASNPLRIL